MKQEFSGLSGRPRFTAIPLTTATALALIPGVLHAQEFVWDITPDATVVGGAGVWDENTTPNFQSPVGVPNQTFPGNAAVAFTEPGPGASDVTVEGNVTVTGLRFDVSGYTITSAPGGGLELVAPTVNLTLGTGVTAEIDVEMDSGPNFNELNIQGNGTLTLGGSQFGLSALTVQVDATLLSFAANTGDLTNFGDTTNNGSFNEVLNFGLYVNNSFAQVAGDATNDGGIMLLSGFIGGTLSNDAGDVQTIGDLNIGGAVINADEIIFDDSVSVSGTVENDGSFVVSSDTTVTGLVTNSADFFVVAGGTLIANSGIENDGQLDINGQLVGDATLNAGSTTTLLGSIVGDVDNTGILEAESNALIDGNLVNNRTVTLATDNTAATELTMTGDVSGSGTYVLDLDLSGEGSGDTVVVGGTTTGTVALSFNIIGTPVVATQQSILVFDVNDAAANSFTFTVGTPLPNDGISVYSVVQDGMDGDLYVIGQVNPGASSVAGNLVLTQSLIGAVVNRPTSPFVVGLAYDDPDPCGTGAWIRTQGGRADASAESSNGVSQVQSTVNADYVGFQGGGDFACFNGPVGWDLAVGVMGGYNAGVIEQPVYAIDPLNPAVLTGTLTSITTTDFTQSYLGVYGTASTGPWSADLQFRVERTDFDITNEGVNGNAGLGVEDADLRSDASTLSGAVNYAYAIPDTDFAIIPTAGLALTRGTSGGIDFTDGSRLEIGDFASDVGFVGVTGAWSRIDDDGLGALRTFVTTTYYNDFSDPIKSEFRTPDDVLADVQNDTLGSYGELSLGISYVGLAPVESFAGLKQYATSLRADVRFGDQIDSWGLVGQLRVQY